MDYVLNDFIVDHEVHPADGRRWVTKVHRNNDKRDFILKFQNIPKDLVRGYGANFERMKMISHRNIIKHFEFHILNDSYCPFTVATVLEYANIGPLSYSLKALSEQGKLIPILRQTLDGYCHLHNNKILHRDVKPTNILLTRNGNEIVAKVSDVELTETASGAFFTTPEYLAPESSDFSSYSEKSEVWAIGIMIYELYLGEYPFGSRLLGNTTDEIRNNSRTKEAARINELPLPFNTIVKSALAKDPVNRPNIFELRKMLTPFSLLTQTLRTILKNPR